MKQIWMVKGLGPSHYVHRTRAEADAEAVRLARENPGTPFYVLEAVMAYRCSGLESFSFQSDEELPF